MSSTIEDILCWVTPITVEWTKLRWQSRIDENKHICCCSWLYPIGDSIYTNATPLISGIFCSSLIATRACSTFMVSIMTIEEVLCTWIGFSYPCKAFFNFGCCFIVLHITCTISVWCNNSYWGSHCVSIAENLLHHVILIDCLSPIWPVIVMSTIWPSCTIFGIFTSISYIDIIFSSIFHSALDSNPLIFSFVKLSLSQVISNFICRCKSLTLLLCTSFWLIECKYSSWDLFTFDGHSICKCHRTQK